MTLSYRYNPSGAMIHDGCGGEIMSFKEGLVCCKCHEGEDNRHAWACGAVNRPDRGCAGPEDEDDFRSANRRLRPGG